MNWTTGWRLAAGFAAVLIFVACIGEHQACIELNQKDCATVIAAFRASIRQTETGVPLGAGVGGRVGSRAG